MSPPDAYLEARLHRHRRVEDVMTTAVVTVDRLAPYKEIACLLAEHRISSVPVLTGGWQVIGVVSETDLLAAQDHAVRRRRSAVRRGRHAPLTAGELMTAPPVTLGPDAVHRPGLVRGQDLAQATIRLIWDVDGVVDVVKLNGGRRT